MAAKLMDGHDALRGWGITHSSKLPISGIHHSFDEVTVMTKTGTDEARQPSGLDGRRTALPIFYEKEVTHSPFGMAENRLAS